MHDQKVLGMSIKYFLITPESHAKIIFLGDQEVVFDAELKSGLYFLTIRLESSRGDG